jgi:RNA polymerase sigma factor (TIGR02999 family)
MEDREAGEITVLLGRVSDGDAAARDELLRLVYRELEAIAKAYVDPGASLEPCGLVHELYLRFAAAPIEAHDRKHFYAIAALAMRRILADRARRRRAAKRGGDAVHVTLLDVGVNDRQLDVIAIDGALTKLEALSQRQARVVELRCLLGMSIPETARTLELSERTVQNEWRVARAWLSRELSGGTGP